MTCRRAVYILRCAGQRSRSQGHKIKNAYSAISNQLYTIFFCYFSTNFCETWLVYRQYLVHLPCVTVRHNTKCGLCFNLQMARYSLNNSSIHPTYFLPTRQKAYFLPTRQKAKTSLINVPGRFHQELGWWKPTKAKDAQQCITLYITIHHSMLCYYFRHTTDFIGQNTRGRSPHASLDINTTSNYCPVSLARVAQLVERRTQDSEDPGSNPTNTQPFSIFFFSLFVENMFNTTQKSHLKKRKKILSIWVPILKGTATKNSVYEPSKVTIKIEGRPPCRVSLQVQF